MLIGDVTNAGSLPVLSAAISMAGQRQRLLAHNIANIDTPDFRPVDVDVQGFRGELARAVRARRARTGGEHGPLAGTPEVRTRTSDRQVLYHDRNNRDVERLMQNLAENTLAFRMTTDLIRRQNDLLRSAISQRV